MYEMVIIGAGPAGISMAAEARGVGIPAEKIVVVEKGDAHSWAIRKFYPASKPVLANYKGIKAVCTGVMCLTDMTKEETLTYIDRVIEQNQLGVHYKEAVTGIRPLEGGGFTVETNRRRLPDPALHHRHRHPRQAQQARVQGSARAHQARSLRHHEPGHQG